MMNQPILFGGGLAAVTVGLVCCASLMAGAGRSARVELLAPAHQQAPAAGHKLSSDVFSARQGAQDALVRASRDKMQADLLHEALGGGHPWRHMKNAAAAAAAKEAHLRAVHHSEAWKAGEQALSQRNPWAKIDHSLWKKHEEAATKTSLAANKGEQAAEEDQEKHYVPGTHVETKDVQKEWAHGAPNPRALIHGADRYVTVGHQVVHEGEEATARAGRHQALHNEAAAPTLEGGVAVPGGHVVWLPLKSLASDEVAPRAAAPAREGAAPARAQAGAQQQLQFPAQYSKIVEYGADGQPIATIYGPGSHASAARAGRGRGTRRVVHPHAGHGVQALAAGEDAEGDGGEEVNDSKIEQDVVFRLLHDYGAPELDSSITLTPAQRADADRRAGKESQEHHEWYTFGGRVFESSFAAHGVPSVLLTVAATLLAVLATF